MDNWYYLSFEPDQQALHEVVAGREQEECLEEWLDMQYAAGAFAHLPHIARLCKMNQEGLKRLHAYQIGEEDQTYFDEWLEEQKQHTSHGETEETARQVALLQAIKNGWRVLDSAESLEALKRHFGVQWG